MDRHLDGLVLLRQDLDLEDHLLKNRAVDVLAKVEVNSVPDDLEVGSIRVAYISGDPPWDGSLLAHLVDVVGS